MMKDMKKKLALCAKLMPYGKNYKLLKVLGISMIILGLLMYIISLAEGDTVNAMMPIYFPFMGIVFMESPFLNIFQRGTLAASGLRRTADIYFGTGFAFAGMLGINIVWAICGCIGTALKPEAADVAVLTLVTGVLMFAMYVVVFVGMKACVAVYIGEIVLLCASVFYVKSEIAYLTAVFTDGRSPVGGVAVCGLACTGAMIVIFLLGCIFGRLLYRKNYAKLFTRWTD